MKLFFAPFLLPESNASAITRQLIALLELKIPGRVVGEEIHGHPDFPRIGCISDALQGWGINNVVAAFSPDKLASLPVPFIAVLGENSNVVYTVVKDITPEVVTCCDQRGNTWHKVHLDAFAEKYLGLVLLPEALEPATAPPPEKERTASGKAGRRTISPYWIALFLIFPVALNWWVSGHAAVSFIAYFILSMIGCGLCVLVFLKELNVSSALIARFCGKESDSCDKVLHSARSEIMGIKLSDAATIYFLGTFLYLYVVGPVTGAGTFLLAWLNVCSLPVIAFSLYYQWRIVASWCTFCLGLSAVLVLQMVVAAAAGWHSSAYPGAVSLLAGLQLFSAFILSSLIVLAGLTLIRSLYAIRLKNAELLRLSRNTDILSAILTTQRRMIGNPDGFCLSLGPSSARNVIVKVCDPYCVPCSRSHDVLKDLLSKQDVQIKYVFSVTTDPGDEGAEVVRYFLANESSEAGLSEIMNDWYLSPVKDLKSLSAKHPVVEWDDGQRTRIARMDEWCQRNHISRTPTFFINGFQLPEQYSAQDIRYFLS